MERVTFHSAENGFCVLRVKAAAGVTLIAVLGHAAMNSAGEFLQANGAWVNNRTRCSFHEGWAGQPISSKPSSPSSHC
jgi:hypothetical protein